MYNNIAVFGASGAIGSALISLLRKQYPNTIIYAFSQSEIQDKYENVHYHKISYTDENTLKHSADEFTKGVEFDLIFVATGILHKAGVYPEKSLKELSFDTFNEVYMANAVFPAMVAKYFIPKLNKSNKSVFAAISARVGSISDNRLGGWYAYRMSKAALNMFIKTASIEASRSNKKSVIVGLHPGTVNSKLSEPFQNRVPDGKLFSPEYSAQKLLSVLDDLTADDTGKCFAWDSKEILP